MKLHSNRIRQAGVSTIPAAHRRGRLPGLFDGVFVQSKPATRVFLLPKS
jgi:hypothetical protein